MVVKRNTQLPSPLYCSHHPFKVISHHTNSPCLLWTIPLIVFILQRTPSDYFTPYDLVHESNGFNFKKSRDSIFKWKLLLVLTIQLRQEEWPRWLLWWHNNFLMTVAPFSLYFNDFWIKIDFPKCSYCCTIKLRFVLPRKKSSQMLELNV